MHFSGPAGADRWIVELRDEHLRRVGDGEAGERIELPCGVHLTLSSSWPDPAQRRGSRLWIAEIAVESGVSAFFGTRDGRSPTTTSGAIGRSLTTRRSSPTNPEAPRWSSAARPFSLRLLADLWRAGVAIAPLRAAHGRLLAGG